MNTWRSWLRESTKEAPLGHEVDSVSVSQRTGVGKLADLLSRRLRIEALRTSHAEEVVSALQSPELYTYLPEEPPTAEALEQRYAFLEKGSSPDGQALWLNWVAFLHDAVTPVATFQATLPKGKAASIAYLVFPSFWRQGYAREMATRVIDHLFEVYAIPSLYAEIDTRNMGSIRLAESLGLTRIKTTQGDDVFKGASSDEYTYALSREDWSSWA